MISILSTPSERQLNAGIAILRVIAGVIFLAHGAQKLFVYGLEGVTGAFAGMGVPAAGLIAPAVSLLEFFGGLALAVGLLTRPVALALALNMLGAIMLVHLPAGFFLPNGSEFALSLLGSSLLLTLSGAGKYSIDERLARRSERESIAPMHSVPLHRRAS